MWQGSKDLGVVVPIHVISFAFRPFCHNPDPPSGLDEGNVAMSLVIRNNTQAARVMTQ